MKLVLFRKFIMNLMRYKLLYFIVSVLIILPGLYYLLTSGLKLGIDFTGGGLLEYKFEQSVDKSALEKYGVVTSSGDNAYIIRTSPQEYEQLQNTKAEIRNALGNFETLREENVGPTIGNELKQRALIAIGLAVLAILAYVTYAFRKVPKPTTSWRFGIATIVALIHDVLFVVGLFAMLGHFFHVEMDILFVTAMLTIIGFSVHDTIVVFDRIRENLPKYIGQKFETVANISVTQTLARSLNTSLTVVFVLVALLLFGGDTVKWFVIALLAGVVSGTYSSIFNATALLAWWEEKLGH
jgi:preprotein translocase subunit SecF